MGLLAGDPLLFAACIRSLNALFGPVDIESGLLPWGHTDYYREEMGQDLCRKFVFFERLISPDDLSWIKCRALTLEQAWSVPQAVPSRRTINIDPGYLTEAKVVLATTKDFPHRIAIGNGIFAESTLQYDRAVHGYMPCAHTYPDFRTRQTLALFSEARTSLRCALNRLR